MTYIQKVRSQNTGKQLQVCEIIFIGCVKSASVTEVFVKKFRLRSRLLHWILRDSNDAKLSYIPRCKRRGWKILE